jgi:hypothetical protein
VAALAATASLSACLSERPRPAPPLLRVTLNPANVTSPDTLTGTLRAEDQDGIDSVWVNLDTQHAGVDGFFDRVVTGNFRFTIPAGLATGSILDLHIEARDVVGFTSTVDTSVTVIP